MSMSIDKIPHVLDWFPTFSGSETRLEIVTDLSLPGDADHTAEEFFKLRKQLEQYLGRDADIDIAFHYKERPSNAQRIKRREAPPARLLERDRPDASRISFEPLSITQP